MIYQDCQCDACQQRADKHIADQQAARIAELEAEIETRKLNAEQRFERIKELEAELEAQVAASTEYVNALSFTRRDLAVLQKRIADAPVVAEVGGWWNGRKGFDLCNFKGRRPEPGTKLISKEDLL